MFVVALDSLSTNRLFVTASYVKCLFELLGRSDLVIAHRRGNVAAQLLSQDGLLNEAEHALERTTGLAAEIRPAPIGTDRGIDAVLELVRDRRRHRFLVEVTAVDRFETPAD